MKPAELLTLMGGLAGLGAGAYLTLLYASPLWLIVTLYPSFIIAQLLVVAILVLFSGRANQDG